jgi:hypothetical protein
MAVERVPGDPVRPDRKAERFDVRLPEGGPTGKVFRDGGEIPP